VDDPALNQALVEAFWGDFHLCSAFKKLFVYSRASPLERRFRFVNLPAWALQSDKIYYILPRVLPDLESYPERVVFETELRSLEFGAGAPQFGAGGGGAPENVIRLPGMGGDVPGMGVDVPGMEDDDYWGLD
jgi:hypothetical protein